MADLLRSGFRWCRPDGYLCRCTGSINIVKAVKLSARLLRGKKH